MFIFSVQPMSNLLYTNYIQCVEATFLGCFLTDGILDIDRVPLSFKSRCQGRVFRHMVLAVRIGGRWGCMGMSRRGDLMDKPVEFGSLADLIEDFNVSYKRNFHTLLACYVGLPFSHGRALDSPIKWRALKARVDRLSPEELRYSLAAFTESMFDMLDRLRSTGSMLGLP